MKRCYKDTLVILPIRKNDSNTCDQHPGVPETINSDQGSQFTGHEYIDYIKSLKTVNISMDGKCRATDNAYIERFFRSIKYEKLYLLEPKDGKELFELCKIYISFYNGQHGHSSIGDVPPTRVYRTAA